MDVYPLEPLPAGELSAIAEMWKRQRREFIARFGGASMLPTIAPGEPLRVACDGQAAEGDVILFLSRGALVVHRLLKRTTRSMITRGDRNAIPDRPFRSDSLIGRVTAIERGNVWLPVPPWIETPAQRRLRRVAACCLAVSTRLASSVLSLFWQIHRAREAFLRLGMAGFCARLWTLTGGRIADIDVVLTVSLATEINFSPVPGFRYTVAAAGSPEFISAARLLGVDPRRREEQDSFVAMTAAGEVVACTFSDRPASAIASQRGVAVDTRYRGQGLGASVLRYQARELRDRGVARIDYHVGLTNRASRRMFRGLGARPRERWIIVTLLRRFRFARSKSFEAS